MGGCVIVPNEWVCCCSGCERVVVAAVVCVADVAIVDVVVAAVVCVADVAIVDVVVAAVVCVGRLVLCLPFNCLSRKTKTNSLKILIWK